MSRLRVPAIAPGDRSPIARVRDRLPLAGRTWAFASGSGGVGRSTLAAVVGSRLVHRGHSVCLVDADWTGPSLASIFDVPTGSVTSLWGGAPLRAERTAEHPDLRLVCGPPPVPGDPSRAEGRRLLEQLGALSANQILVDLPAGATDVALDLWLAADYPVLVAVPERIPLEATARLLARVFARETGPWLSRRLGAAGAREVLAEAWEDCAGRTGAWMRAVARRADVEPEVLAERASRRPLYLLLNRARRGDDVDVGHALVTAAGHGLGLDLRFRAVLPFEEDGWIRSRRTLASVPGTNGHLMGVEADSFLDRMSVEADVPSAGDWRGNLREAAAAAGR